MVYVKKCNPHRSGRFKITLRLTLNPKVKPMDEQLNSQNNPDTEADTLRVMNEEIEAAAPKAPVVITKTHLKQAAEALASIIGFLGLNAEVRAEVQNNKVLLTVSSTDAGRIIGRKGQTLESIQFILSRMLLKGEEIFPRMSIDIDGYARQGILKEGHQRRNEGQRSERPDRGDREQGRGGEGRDRNSKYSRGSKSSGPSFSRERISPEREETLAQQAVDYAKEVVKWGEPITLPPMNAMERRIIHIALQDNTDVVTESIGDGARKSVVISQK